jgi:hypothetical protein
MPTIDNRLSALGLCLPPPTQPPPGVVLPFQFVHVVGTRVLVSGHGPQAPDGSARLARNCPSTRAMSLLVSPLSRSSVAFTAPSAISIESQPGSGSSVWSIPLLVSPSNPASSTASLISSWSSSARRSGHTAGAPLAWRSCPSTSQSKSKPRSSSARPARDGSLQRSSLVSLVGGWRMLLPWSMHAQLALFHPRRR